MTQRRIGQSSLAGALLPAGAGTNRRLERIAGLIDGARFERRFMPLRAPAGPAIRGRPCSRRSCSRSGTGSPIRAWKRRGPTAIHSAASVASAWMTACPTRRRSAGSGPRSRSEPHRAPLRQGEPPTRRERPDAED